MDNHKLLNTVFIGIDVHKYSHTAVAIDCFNQEIFVKEFSNQTTVEFIQEISIKLKDKELIFGLEDVNGNGKALSRSIISQGYTVLPVAPILVDREKSKSTHKEKSDYIDAKGVAKVILYNQKTLPQQIITEEANIAKSIDGLIIDRDLLVKNQTQVKNHLHALLHQILGDSYKELVLTKSIFSARSISKYKDLLETIKTVESKRILRKLDELILIQNQIKEIDKDLRDVCKQSKQVESLQELEGCGLLTSCKIVAEIGDIKRFKSKSKLARYAGLSPRKNSSAGKGKSRTDLFGNRKLNRAIHTIALSSIGNRGNEESKKYYSKKQKEGKSKLHSIRCLKRSIVNRIFNKLHNLT
jgi:transposase